MINPYDITNYYRTENELQELLLFCILVAGKTAYIQAQKLEKFLDAGRLFCNLNKETAPFKILKALDDKSHLYEMIVEAKLGQYKKIFNAFNYIIQNKIDLKECGPTELERIPGVGMKTSRFFILHSRDVQSIAVLDVHILKFLGSLGHKVPKTTPNKKQYYYLEQKFLDHCKDNNLHPASADLEIWKFYAKKEKEVDANV